MAIPQARRGERGLTLVEMLVVLAIIGVMAGAVALSLGRGGGDRRLETEANRLASRLRLAADDVRLDERPLVFGWDAHGYQFGQWDRRTRRWLPDRLERLGRHDLPAGMSLEAVTAAAATPIVPDGSGPPIALRLSTRQTAWVIRFDGLDATATVAR